MYDFDQILEMDMRKTLKELIDKLVPCTLPLREKDFTPAAKPEDIWNAVLSLISNDQKLFFTAFPFLIEYSKLTPKFNENNPQQVCDEINKLKSITEKDKKLEAFKQLFCILPFFNEKNFNEFIGESILYLQHYLNENQNLPTEFLDIIQLAELSYLKEEMILKFFETLKLYFITENRPAAMIISTILLQDIIDNEENGDENGNYFIQIATESLKPETTKQEKLAALYLISKLNHFLAQEEADIPSSLFPSLLSFFVSPDTDLFNVSHKSMVQLIKCGVFSEKQHTLDVINQYPFYQKEEQVPQFFKFLAKYLDDYESVPISIIQIIYDFLVGNIYDKNNTPLRIAFCLETFSLLAAANKDVLDGTTDQLLVIANELVETCSNDSLIMSKVACFILALTKLIPDTLPLAYERYVPIFIKNLQLPTKKEERKSKLDLAQSTSAIIEDSSIDHFAAPLIDFSVSILEDTNRSELVYLGSIVLALRAQFTQEQAEKAFALLFNIVKKSSVSQDVNICLHMMKKLFMKQNIKFEIVSDVVAALLNGDIESLSGITPNLSGNTKTMIFYFVSSFIKKYPLNSGPFVSKIVSWVPETRVSLLPAVLEAIEAALTTNVLPPDSIQSLYDIIMKLYLRVPVQEEEEYCSVVEILILLVNNYSNVCNAKDILTESTKMLALCHGVDCRDDNVKPNDEEEDENDVTPCEDTQVLPTIIRLVLSVYASQQLNAEVSKDLINGVLEDIPTSSMSDILPVLLKLMKQQARFKPVLVPICRMISELLLLKKSQQEEIGISDEMLNNAKASLKEVVKANRLIERQLMKDYSSNKAKLNRFNALIK